MRTRSTKATTIQTLKVTKTFPRMSHQEVFRKSICTVFRKCSVCDCPIACQDCVGCQKSGRMITASIVVLHLAGCIYPLPIRSYSSTRDLVKTRYGLLGSLTPEPLFVNDPTPPPHLTLNEYLYCFSLSCKKLLFIISTFLRQYIHRRHPIFHLFSHFPRPPPSPHS